MWPIAWAFIVSLNKRLGLVYVQNRQPIHNLQHVPTCFLELPLGMKHGMRQVPTIEYAFTYQQVFHDCAAHTYCRTYTLAFVINWRTLACAIHFILILQVPLAWCISRIEYCKYLSHASPRCRAAGANMLRVGEHEMLLHGPQLKWIWQDQS